MPQLVNHGRDRKIFGDAERPGKDLLRLGSYDDRDHSDSAERNRQDVSEDVLAKLRKLPAFNAYVQKGDISVYGA